MSELITPSPTQDGKTVYHPIDSLPDWAWMTQVQFTEQLFGALAINFHNPKMVTWFTNVLKMVEETMDKDSYASWVTSEDDGLRYPIFRHLRDFFRGSTRDTKL